MFLHHPLLSKIRDTQETAHTSALQHYNTVNCFLNGGIHYVKLGVLLDLGTTCCIQSCWLVAQIPYRPFFLQHESQEALLVLVQHMDIVLFGSLHAIVTSLTRRPGLRSMSMAVGAQAIAKRIHARLIAAICYILNKLPRSSTRPLYMHVPGRPYTLLPRNAVLLFSSHQNSSKLTYSSEPPTYSPSFLNSLS